MASETGRQALLQPLLPTMSDCSPCLDLTNIIKIIISLVENVLVVECRADSSAPASSMASETDRQALVQPLLRASSLTGQPGRDVTDLFDLTFWMGDLNYRLVGTRANVDFALGQHMYELLKPLDQLLLERAKGVVFQVRVCLLHASLVGPAATNHLSQPCRFTLLETCDQGIGYGINHSVIRVLIDWRVR